MTSLWVDVEFNLDGLGQIADELRDKIQRKIAFDIYSELVLTTPVDTGRARAGWAMDVRQGTYKPPLDGTAYRMPMPDIPKGAPWIIIYNNVEYIVPLNEGHSKQAPKRFVQRAIERVKRGAA